MPFFETHQSGDRLLGCLKHQKNPRGRVLLACAMAGIPAGDLAFVGPTDDSLAVLFRNKHYCFMVLATPTLIVSSMAPWATSKGVSATALRMRSAKRLMQ